MFEVTKEMQILCTRGDVGVFTVSATIDGTDMTFEEGEAIRFKVYTKKNCDDVVLNKTIGVNGDNLTEDNKGVIVRLSEEETRIGGIISKPVDYWYEIEHVDRDGNVRTIIGYDSDGAKVFTLYPEGKDAVSPVKPTDIPIIDKELDATSNRPIENQAVSRVILELRGLIQDLSDRLDSLM